MIRAVALSALAAGCGPSMVALVAGHHDREAVCAAVDGSSAVRDRLGAALEADAEPAVQVYPVPPSQLEELLGAAQARVRFVRVTLSTNRIPVDTLDARIALGQPISWPLLASLTGETLPLPHAVRTYATSGNVARGLGALLTLGLGLPFLNFHAENVVTDPLDVEYAERSPRAHALFWSLHDTPCVDPERGKVAGHDSARCTWFVALPAVGPLDLQVDVDYRADRAGHDPERDLEHRERCTLTRRAVIHLGDPAHIDATAERMFGSVTRPLSEVAQRR